MEGKVLSRHTKEAMLGKLQAVNMHLRRSNHCDKNRTDRFVGAHRDNTLTKLLGLDPDDSTSVYNSR